MQRPLVRRSVPLMSPARRAHACSSTTFALVRSEWSSFAHMLATLLFLIALVVMVATQGDALRPRRGLRADVLGCVHVGNAPAVKAAHLSQFTTLTEIRLRREYQPHSTWARRVELPAGQTVHRTIRLSWRADSMTDTIRVTASDGFVGVTMSFAASAHSPWWGRAAAWTDVAGAESDLGRIRVDPTRCSRKWNHP